MARLPQPEVTFSQLRHYLTNPHQLQLYFQQRHSAFVPHCSPTHLLQLLAGEKPLLRKRTTIPEAKQILSMWSGSKKLLIKAIKAVPELVSSLPDELEKVRLVDLCRAVYVFDPHFFETAIQRYNVCGEKPWKRIKMYSLRQEFANVLLLLPARHSGESDFLASDSHSKMSSS